MAWIFMNLISLDQEKYSTYLIWYGTPTIAFILQMLYVLRPRKAKSEERKHIQVYYAGLLFITMMQLFQGPSANIYYFYLVMLPLPFFYYGFSQRFIIWMNASLGSGALVALHFSKKYLQPWFPVPEEYITVINDFVIVTVAFSILYSCYTFWRQNTISELALAEETEKAENLLRNILPVDIIESLKKTGQAIPVRHNKITVLFSDFVGFTKIAEKMSPEKLISELEICFREFDAITKSLGLEKIKTIGDGYMLAGGLNSSGRSGAEHTALAALRMRDFINDWKKARKNQKLPVWDIRIGLHTGPLVAGVISDMKFAYDLFGDTVNTASRMESSGLPGEINCSETVYKLLNKKFIFENRGLQAVKGKGKMKMYTLKN
ncbi:MAG: adenylate/guanylate cyclase domain-containing protein [Leptospiraceae bacterium]|nr:adenylate/guanylate cyclase domain-containing protein [Leptospiraceae bacterium]